MTNIITPIGYNTPMTYHTLHQMHDEKHIKHLGNRVLVLTPDYAVGYTIKSYDGYTPELLNDKVYTDRRNIEFGNWDAVWDAVYDFLYGAPTQLPNFNETINL